MTSNAGKMSLPLLILFLLSHPTFSSLYYDWYTNKLANIELSSTPQFHLTATSGSQITLTVHYSRTTPLGERVRLGQSPPPLTAVYFTTPEERRNITWWTVEGVRNDFVSLAPRECSVSTVGVLHVSYSHFLLRSKFLLTEVALLVILGAIPLVTMTEANRQDSR